MDIPLAQARPRTCQILRLDYGYSPGATPGWEVADLAWTPLDAALSAGAPARGLLLRNAEVLLGWARTKGGATLWRDLAGVASSRGLCLVCRFPRRADELASHLRRPGLSPVSWESPADGRTPPLYEALSDKPGLQRFHLEYEWLTGLGAARGGAALLGAAFVLAGAGAAPAAAVASALGITAGAARSYLSWMEDAALARRDGAGYALRHPLLATLFGAGAGRVPGTGSPAAGRAKPSQARLRPPPPRAPVPRPQRRDVPPEPEAAPPQPRRPDPMDFD